MNRKTRLCTVKSKMDVERHIHDNLDSNIDLLASTETQVRYNEVLETSHLSNHITKVTRFG